MDWDTFRFVAHYGGHWLLPLAIAYLWRPQQWVRLSLILLSTNLVDIDHLLADPIFDPDRLSVGFHYLHSYPAIAGYILLLAWPKARPVAVGLLVHMGVDLLDYGMR